MNSDEIHQHTSVGIESVTTTTHVKFLNPAPPSDMKLGRNLARTFLDYYKLNGYVSSKPSSGLNPKPGKYGSSTRATAADRRETGFGRSTSEPLRMDERSVRTGHSLTSS